MSRACLITLVAFAVISCAAASRILEDDAAVMGRELLQTKADRFICSDWCEANQCFRVGTTGIVRCNKCKNNLRPIPAGVNAGQCGCPPGTYFDKTVNNGDCVACPFGSYCNKQLTWVPNGQTGQLGITACAENLTTRARRSTSMWDCVNAGGYALSITATGPQANKCLLNTYAIAKSKQAACTPCPSGMIIPDAGDKRDKPTSCLVPAGYFLKSPGQIAPCDQGSYQPKYLGQAAATVGVCTACAEGVTTADKGSNVTTECKWLKPGYFAKTITDGVITEAVLCPQGWYCPGSKPGSDADVTAISHVEPLNTDPNGNLLITNTAYLYVSAVTGDTGALGTARIIQCNNKAWTKTVGATSSDQCLVPPGFEIVNTGDDITPCSNEQYRSDWINLPAAATKKCVACGAGIFSEAIEPITLYSLNITNGADANTDYTVVNVKVSASSKSCFITKGQGMYYVASGTAGKMIYKAKDCGLGAAGYVPNSYGVAGDKVYGLAQTPCKLCPANMVVTTSTPSSNYSVTGANFWDPLACVTKPGYGYDGRVSSLCAKGWYNEGNNYLACTQCAYGLTTDVPNVEGTNTDAEADCQAAPGFGNYNGTMQQCPAGTYNDVWRAKTLACKPCTGSSWTEEDGSDASTDCSICKPGYGSSTPGDLTACGECGGTPGTYGPPGRASDDLPCVACPKTAVGFQFWYNNTAYAYKPDPTAAAKAEDAADCVSSMAQIEDGLWWLAGAEADTGATTESSVEDCAATCTGDDTCALATFDYANGDCKRLVIDSESGSIITAFKAVPSSDVSQSRKLQAAKPKAVSTGMYTQWKYAGTALTTPTTNKKTTTNGVQHLADCFDLCDALDSCAAVVYSGTSCTTIEGATDPADTTNASKRSLTHAVPSKFAI